jgi:hypothetical protein
LQDEIEKEVLKSRYIDEFVPMVKNVLDNYRGTNDPEKKNRLLKSILEKATYLRKTDWKQKDHFVINIYPKI